MSEHPPEKEASPGGRSGMVAMVGRANVGKSSLGNAVIGEKLSIVSPVAQTTRNVIRGILTGPRGQLVLVDTPGLHKAPGDLGRVMNRVARSSVEGTDVILLVLDAAAPVREEDEGWMRRLARMDTPLVFALNKADLGPNHEPNYRACWSRVAAESGTTQDPEWMVVSAVTGEGLAAMVERLYDHLPEGPMLFPEDMLSDYPRKLNMADIVREKLFLQLREELPHAIAVWVEHLDDTAPEWKAKVNIYVNKPSQKGIVIGEKGRMLRKVRRMAEAELAEIYGCRVQLELWVRIEKNWDRNFWLLKKFGYVG